MRSLAPLAQVLLHTLCCLLQSDFQEDSLQALLGLYLEAQGHSLPLLISQAI